MYAEDGTVLDGRAWQTNAARLRDPVDRANWQRVVAAGAPGWLGKGYGMATARTHRVCAFGARFQLAPSATLHHVDTELQALHELVLDMASAPPEGFRR